MKIITIIYAIFAIGFFGFLIYEKQPVLATEDAYNDFLSVLYRAMPTRSIEYLNPFPFLNHHDLKIYKADNEVLTFGPHPHRGFETLTYILKAHIVHWDSNGHKSAIEEGGVQCIFLQQATFQKNT